MYFYFLRASLSADFRRTVLEPFQLPVQWQFQIRALSWVDLAFRKES